MMKTDPTGGRDRSPGFRGVPPPGCRKCPRLVAFRRQHKRTHPQWQNRAIPPWGDPDGTILILGLAPGLKGANRTGRVFTGDGAGVFLFENLRREGFVTGHYGDDGKDDLRPVRIAITNAVACVPPQNRPTPAEEANCLPFIRRQISAMPDLAAILCLGHLAHKACLNALDLPRQAMPFAHGACHHISPQNSPAGPLALFDSYHCSRYNTQTRRLTAVMFRAVLQDLRTYIDGCA